MNFAEYINWIITHPEDFTFVISIVESGTKVYLINHTDPYTGKINQVIHCLLVGPILVDMNTNLSIVSAKDVFLDKFEELALNKEQELLDKGEGNIEDEA